MSVGAMLAVNVALSPPLSMKVYESSGALSYFLLDASPTSEEACSSRQSSEPSPPPRHGEALRMRMQCLPVALPSVSLVEMSWKDK